MRGRLSWWAALVAVVVLAGACSSSSGSGAPSGAAASGGTSAECAGTGTKGGSADLQIPDIESGKFNVAMVLIGPHDDGGWSQAHYEGLQYLCEHVANSHVAYIELVPEGADSEQVFRSLARKGFDFIIGTSFGYMATFPIPEELRLGNAFALGMRKTCPECTLDVRWINTWHDPVKEKEGAASLFDAGAQVVFTGADTPASADVAQEKGKWGITYDWVGSCKVERCLTTPYWNWGPIYAKIAAAVNAGTYKAGYDYFDADAGGLGLYGFMEGQTPTKGVSDLPPEVIQNVKDTLAKMQKGEFTRFDVFAGPIKDNTGKEIVPAGAKMEQIDLDQFDPKSGCKYCMHWWAEGITAELPPAS